MPGEYQRWVQSHGPEGITELRDFFRGVSETRYVIRRVIRIVDEEARRNHLDPLEHQVLIQLLGAEGQVLNINRVAERLDVPAAVASRLVKRLEERGYVVRRKSRQDRRMTDVHIADAGQSVCVDIWEDVWVHIDEFQRNLDVDAKRLALSVFGFYVGVSLDVREIERSPHSPEAST